MFFPPDSFLLTFYEHLRAWISQQKTKIPDSAVRGVSFVCAVCGESKMP